MNEYLSAGDPQTPEDARISAVYKRAARESPPADLDRKIAAAARAGSRTTSAGRLLSWFNMFRIPLATAAVIVVSASLVISMREEHENRVVNLPSVSPGAPAEAVRSEDTSAPQPAVPAQRKPERPEMPFGDRAQGLSGAGTATARQSQRKLPNEESRIERRMQLKSSPQKARDRAKAEDFEARTTASSAEQPAPTGIPAPMAAPEPGFASRPEAVDTPPPPEPRLRSQPMVRALPAPAMPGASGALRGAEPRPYAPPASGSAEGVGRAPAAAAPEPARERTAEERRLALGRPQALNLPPPDISAHLAVLESRPPAAWLDRVRLLQREGLLLEAERLLTEFKRRFPEEPIPADVQ
jgi:hypothetical protein